MSLTAAQEAYGQLYGRLIELSQFYKVLTDFVSQLTSLSVPDPDLGTPNRGDPEVLEDVYSWYVIQEALHRVVGSELSRCFKDRCAGGLNNPSVYEYYILEPQGGEVRSIVDKSLPFVASLDCGNWEKFKETVSQQELGKEYLLVHAFRNKKVAHHQPVQRGLPPEDVEVARAVRPLLTRLLSCHAQVGKILVPEWSFCHQDISTYSFGNNEDPARHFMEAALGIKVMRNHPQFRDILDRSYEDYRRKQSV